MKPSRLWLPLVGCLALAAGYVLAACGGEVITQEPTAQNVLDFLPPFHEELDRLVAPRDEGPPAVLVVSAPDQPEPRPVTMTLLESDRGEYRIADTSEFECSYLTDLEVDEDQAIFLGCNGGASANWLWAVLPDRLELNVLPLTSDPEQSDGWLNSGWEHQARSGQPDDLTISVNDCTPSCVDGGLTDYHLRWDDGFRKWNLSGCTSPFGDEVTFPEFTNGSGSVGDFPPCLLGE